MDPAPPEKQRSPGISASVEAVPESISRSEPAANMPTSGPTTPEGRSTDGISILGDTTLEPQSVLNATSPITLPEQKGPDNPSLQDTEPISPTLSFNEYIIDVVIKTFVQILDPFLRESIANSGLVMGCTRSYKTCYTTPVAEIRQILSSIPSVGAKYMVDITASIMLIEWEKQCRHVILKYREQMRRDLVEDAKAGSDALKSEILEAVGAKVRAFKQQSGDESRPTTPTPAARAPPTTPTTPSVDVIDTAVGCLGIQSPMRTRRLGGQDSPKLGSPVRSESFERRVPRTPTSSLRLTAPARFSTPQGQRSRNRAPMTPRPGLPGESPLKAHAGMLGSPVRRLGLPPQFKLSPRH